MITSIHSCLPPVVGINKIFEAKGQLVVWSQARVRLQQITGKHNPRVEGSCHWQRPLIGEYLFMCETHASA